MRSLKLVGYVVAALVVVLGLVWVSSASAVDRKRDCRTVGKTLAANAKVRVFYRFAPGGGRLYRACDVRRRKVRYIGSNGGFGLGITREIALAGRYVAYEDIICSREGNCSGSVYRLDVISGDERVVAVMDSDAPPATDLEMSASRAVYWIRATADGYAVVRGAPGGHRVLESGAGVEPRSLAVKGRTAYWTSGGQARSFTG